MGLRVLIWGQTNVCAAMNLRHLNTCAHRGLAHENNSFKCARKRVLDAVATPCLEEFHTPSLMW